MTTTTTVRLLPLLLFLAGCVTPGPSLLDVQADRARWEALHMAVADRAIDDAEHGALGVLFDEWDKKLVADEVAASNASARRDTMADLVRVYGDAAVSVVLADADLQAKAKAAAPDLFALADRDGSGSLSLAEILTLDPTSPVFAVVVATTVARLVRR
jgi:hypothetical protein